ncbi:MAG: hypothetical protein RBQ81_09020 [Arcobacteraceae bacterium]|nr:hypothetical protein [Arcobacteraceae bacterium]
MARVSHTFEKIDPNNPVVKHKHFTVMQPTPIKNEKWTRMDYYDNQVSIYMGLKHKKNRSVWIDYGLEIRTYSGENYTFKDGLVFGKTIIAGYNEQVLTEKEAMKKEDKGYLEARYLNNKYWEKRGIVSARYGNVNKYPAIELVTKTKYRDIDKYSKIYKLYSYSKTGKLKAYEITISVDIDKPNADDPELLVHYSFEDMLKRSQRSLDSFVASDEDFPKDAPRYQ